MKRIVRNRIGGVSFHVRRPGIQRGPGTRTPSRHLPALLGQDSLSERPDGSGAPAPLEPRDIHRLLGDFGRQELHTLVSDAVDAAVRWKQVVDALERNAPLGDAFGAEPRGFVSPRAVEALLDARRALRLWRHRLEILEMVADAQKSLLTLGKRKQG